MMRAHNRFFSTARPLPPHLTLREAPPPPVFTSRPPPYPREEPAVRRPRDHTFFSKRLTWVLRHGALEVGIRIRPDGFVRAADIKRHPRFRYLPPPEFDAMFWKDLTRYAVQEEYDARLGSKVLWIRSNGNHTIKNVSVASKRISTPAELPVAIYPLTLAEWGTVGQHGIPPSRSDGFIHLLRCPPGEDADFFARRRTAVSGGLCIFLDVSRMLAAGIKLFLNRSGKGRDVLTDGDENGVIPPGMFERVVRVRVEREDIL